MDPITQQVVLATAGAAAGENYWIADLGGTSSEGNGIALDSSYNVYVCGRTVTSDALFAKYNNAGAIQAQRTIGGANFDNGRAIAVDSSGNIYIGIQGSSVGAGSNDACIVKMNSSLVIQWQRTLGGTSSDGVNGLVIDSSGNVYASAFTVSTGAGSTDCLIFKYNSSGTLQWQRTLGSANQEFCQAIAIDSSNNLYITGRAVSGTHNCLIAKYNSSGTIQWQRTLGGTENDQGNDIAVDSSGNVYVTGQTKSGDNDVFVAKYNSSGTIQWQRILGTSSSDSGHGIAVDDSGNVYVVGSTQSGGGNPNILIAKYNSSGTAQWQRSLTGNPASNNDEGNKIEVDNEGNIYIVGFGYTSSATAMLIAKLPDDGSLTGTYGDFTYSSLSLTSSAGGLTDAASSLTDSSSSLTDSASSLTLAVSSLTSTTTTL